ncbi:hypothetical protein FQN54_009912 [Arachnomyces sp. PD_36]|nr:hypothetical protein FQN54_009912 [Arachnomyces sp. PD_36]
MKPIIAIPLIVALIYRAYSRESLTPIGIVVATLTAIVHAIHPWSAPFTFLGVFFLAGTTVTKVKHDVKSRLTISASSAGGGNGKGGEGPRTHVQVLANSVVASVLILLHVRRLRSSPEEEQHGQCFAYNGRAGDVLIVGIVANYAAVAADTFSSELGILSRSKPRLITSPTLRVVPPGTNGGITPFGTAAGFLGAFVIGLSSAAVLPFCSSTGLGSDWGWGERAIWILAVTGWGGLGSLLDSLLGGLLQASVVDKRSGKVVEGIGGQKVLVHPGSVKSTATTTAKGVTAATHQTKPDPEYESRKVESGHDILDNNAVNVLMAALMSGGAIVLASYVWEVPLSSVLLKV